MAWNPTPEVQVARDAAKALTKAGRFIDRCVILFTTEQGQIGYASYGKDSNHCGQARRLADVLYERAAEAVENIEDFHHRQRATDGSDIDWDGLEREMSMKLRLLRRSLDAFPGPGNNEVTRTMYMRDLVLPAVELLARFGNCVNLVQDEPTTGPVCDDCGCPSPDPESLHEATGIRICQACEDRAAAKAREHEPSLPERNEGPSDADNERADEEIRRHG